MAGVDLGNAWGPAVWEEGVWAEGVWATEAAPDVPGQAGDLSAASRANKQRGALAGMMLRGFRAIVFFIAGVQ
jgi:hypothetical protein